LEKKIRKNKFDFNDFLSQIRQIKKMGDMKSLVSMIPGVGKALKDVDFDENQLGRVEAIIFSMTKEERAKPEVLNMSRKKRIAQGCGQDLNQINMFIKQFDQMRKMMHKMTKMPGFDAAGGDHRAPDSTVAQRSRRRDHPADPGPADAAFSGAADADGVH